MASILRSIQSLCFRSQPVYDDGKSEWDSDFEITRSTFERTMEQDEAEADNMAANDDIEKEENHSAVIEMHDTDGAPFDVQAFDDASESYPDSVLPKPHLVSPPPPTSKDEAEFVNPRDYAPERKRRGRSLTFAILLALVALVLLAHGSMRGEKRSGTVSNAAMAAPGSDTNDTSITFPPTGMPATTINVTIPTNTTTPESTAAQPSNGTNAVPESTPAASPSNSTAAVPESTPALISNSTAAVPESTPALISNGTNATLVSTSPPTSIPESTPETTPETNSTAAPETSSTEAPETNSTETGGCQATLSVSKTCFEPDKSDPVAISFSQCNPGSQDWIAIYADNEDRGDNYELWVLACEGGNCQGATNSKVLSRDEYLPDGRYRAFLIQGTSSGSTYTTLAGSELFWVATTCL